MIEKLHTIFKSLPTDSKKGETYALIENAIPKSSELMLMLAVVINEDEYKFNIIHDLILQGIKVSSTNLLEICSNFKCSQNSESIVSTWLMVQNAGQIHL